MAYPSFQRYSLCSFYFEMHSNKTASSSWAKVTTYIMFGLNKDTFESQKGAIVNLTSFKI